MEEIDEFVRGQLSVSVAIGFLKECFEVSFVWFHVEEIGEESSAFLFAQCVRLVEIDGAQMTQDPSEERVIANGQNSQRMSTSDR